MTPSAKRLLHLPAMARRLGVPMSWLRREADSGRLPCVRAGSRRLFDCALIEQLLLERARAVNAPDSPTAQEEGHTRPDSARIRPQPEPRNGAKGIREQARPDGVRGHGTQSRAVGRTIQRRGEDPDLIPLDGLDDEGEAGSDAG